MARKPPEPEKLYSGVKLGYGKEKPEEEEIIGAAYVAFTKRFSAMFQGFGKGSTFSEPMQQAFDFLRLDLTAEQVYGTYKGLFVLGFVAAILFAGLAFLGNPDDILIPVVTGAVVLLLGVGVSFAYLYYPQNLADKEKKLAIAYVPEIINYLVMNMRLNPNLERAVEFAAAHGRGKIADDFKKLLWDVQLGVFISVEEGLDDLAYRWGAYNDDFKHSLMMIRASLLEGDARRREELLDRASADVIEGSKEKMDIYARQLHQPTVYLYYFGILLPLMLAIVLPIAAGVIKDLPLKGVLPIFLIYNVILPTIIYLLAANIIGGRPPTYVPPDVPADFELLPPRNTIRLGGRNFPAIPLAILALVGFLYAGYFFDGLIAQGVLDNASLLDKQKALNDLPHLTIPLANYRIYSPSIYALFVGFSLSLSIYLIGKYRERKKIQDEIRGMEVEFKDAMYVLASRLGENRPMEYALKSAVEFLPKSTVANKVFRKILENITQLGMTVEAAIFDPNYGAIRTVPSQVIRSGMRIMVDSVQLGVNVAAMALINLAMQIRNAQKIDEMLRHLLEDVTTMLKTMGTFIAPIVLAVVTSLQRLIISSLASSCPDKAGEAATQTANAGGQLGGTGVSGIFCNLDPKSAVGPAEFTFVMGLYVIQVVILLTYFNSQIEDPNNKLHTWMSVATALPVAAIVFSAVSYFTSTVLIPG